MRIYLLQKINTINLNSLCLLELTLDLICISAISLNRQVERLTLLTSALKETVYLGRKRV